MCHHMYVHARILETAANTVFMAWLPACPPLLHILSQINPFRNPRLQFDCNTGLFEMIVGVLTTCHTQYT